MLNESRIDLYDHLYNLFHGTVTNNVYAMSEPQELTTSDKKDGFIVTHVGNLYDASEFSGEAYGEVRCFIEAFVPPISRGRLNYDMYKEFENRITAVIKNAAKDTESEYFIQEESVLSVEAEEVSNADNMFFTFIKSFIVIINKDS